MVYQALANPAQDNIRHQIEPADTIWNCLVAERLPDQPEALGLLALMLHAEARRSARRDADGEYVPLAQQDPALWNSAMK